MKLYEVFTVLFSTILIAAPLAQATEGNGSKMAFTTAEEKLRSWSIMPEEIGKVIHPPQDPPGNHGYREQRRWVTGYNLSRPGSARCVAVIEISQTGETVLNPLDGYNYGPIPSLQNMTLHEADTLWSDGPKTDDDSASQGTVERTYRFVSPNKKEFSLDVVFTKNHIAKYRLRSTVLRASDWVLVKR